MFSALLPNYSPLGSEVVPRSVDEKRPSRGLAGARLWLELGTICGSRRMDRRDLWSAAQWKVSGFHGQWPDAVQAPMGKRFPISEV